jgi:hypothetical protein
MQPIWKPLAIIALATVAALAGLLAWVSVRENPIAARLRRNIEEQVRYHLGQGEAVKAAAVLESSRDNLGDPTVENTLRLEVARASQPEAGAKILDGLILAAMDHPQAAEAAQTRLDLQRLLFERIVLSSGALPAPFEPTAFLREKTSSASADEMRGITAKLLALIGERRDLAKRHGAPDDQTLARTEALATAARYALGETPYEEVKIDGPELRFRFGDLLFRERQFDRALETWKPMLDEPRVIRRVAELAALRRLAPKNLRLWDYDLENLLGRDARIETEVAESIQALFNAARPGLIDSFSRVGIPRDDDKVIEAPELPPKAEAALDPEQLYLLVDHRQFDFVTTFDRPFLTKADPRMLLHTGYTGPVRFRLFKVRDLPTLVGLDAEKIPARRAELQPVREWERQFEPLGPNGKQISDWLVEIPSCGTGLYVLMAEARYCPVYAFTRFIVTDTGLLQQPALDRVLIHSVDRITGAPVPDFPIEGDITGQYILRPAELLPNDDSNAEEFRRGFDAAWAAKAPEPEAAPSYTRGFQRATALRADHPDMKTMFRGATDKDGLFDWTVAPAWREGYQYTIRTTGSQAGTCTRVESTYSRNSGENHLLSLVYADRPLYRAGDTVSFKALLRRRDGEGLQPYEGRDALVEIGAGDRTIYARSLPVTDFGTASGTVDLSDECPRAGYWMRVNNGAMQTLFQVEDYRKPEFEIALSHPKRVRAGDPVDVLVQVRRYSGEPLAKTRVLITLQNAAAAAATHLIEEWGDYSVKGPQYSWRPIEERMLLTDDDGRCLFRFQTDEGVAARYVVTARATEESRREVSRASGLEASAHTREVLVETDRPVYFQGESARLRFRVAGAATVRVEERAKIEKPFSISVALQDGAGSCDYPVPIQARDLHIGVREGEGWSWTPVPLRIKAHPDAGGLVNVRLDHPIYRVGETAKVELTSSEPNASVLLLVATGRIHRRQLVQLRDRRAEVALPVRDEDIPNVHLVAITVKNDTVGKATAELNVPPLDRFLTVDVTTDLPEYRPGQDCRATVRVSDSQGRPVPDCELSLGVVDDSIYSLQQDLTPDLREYFHRYSRPLRVQESFFYKENLPPFTVWKCPVFVKGQLNLYDSLGVGGGGGGGGRYGGRFGGRENLVARGGGAQATFQGRTRSNFRDTAFWNAHLKTGADGTATATFAFPDNLTRFRFTARGITRAHQVGEVRQETVVRKPFFVTLATPRVLQEGNTIAVCGVIHNRTEQPQTARVQLRSPFPTIGSTAPTLLTLLAGDSARVEYLLSIDAFNAGAELVFSAECDSGESDAVATSVAGRRHGSPFLEGRSGSVAGGGPREEIFRIPAGAISGTVTLKFDFDAGIHTAIAGALEPLIEYPYGCVEQTMSRFLPAVAAKRALGDVPERFREKLPAVIAAGLQRLYSLQQRDGSWGWWRGDSQNGPLTAYVLYGLSICKKAGVGVDRAAADRAAKVLSEELSHSVFSQAVRGSGRLPLRTPLDLRIYGLLALAEYQSAWGASSLTTKQLIGTMADRPDELSAVDGIVLALAATRVGMNDIADTLAKKAELHPPDDVTAASFFLQLQAARGGDLAPAIRFLLGRRAGKGWSNTLETAYAILGLAAAMERPSPAMDLPPGRVEIRVNGEVVQELTLRGAADPAFDGRISIPAPQGGWGEKVSVRLSFDGQGAAFYTASLEAAIGGEDRAPVSRGFEIRRDYFERDADGAGWHPVDGAISVGRTVLVVLRVDTPAQRNYVMISDPRPDGFEPIEMEMKALSGHMSVVEGLSDQVDLERGWPARLDEYGRAVRGDPARESAWAKSMLREIITQRRFVPRTRTEGISLPPSAEAAQVEHRDDRTILFLNALPSGWSTLWYFARAELPGRLHALPPRVEAMYEPELFGSGAETGLVVADGALIRPAARSLENAPGVDGLLQILPSLEAVDADELRLRIPSHPRIGELLVSVCREPAIRAWLASSSATAAAGRGLRERIEAARLDLSTRRLCIDELQNARKEWLPALEAALGDDGLAVQVLRDADPEALGSVDNILLWSMEDRRARLSLLDMAQQLRGSARVEAPGFPRLGIPRVLEALGAKAPTGDALFRWKLSQRASFPGGGLEELKATLERDLGLKVRILGHSALQIEAMEGSVSEILDQSLAPAKVFYRVRDGEILMGPLEELLR